MEEAESWLINYNAVQERYRTLMLTSESHSGHKFIGGGDGPITVHHSHLPPGQSSQNTYPGGEICRRQLVAVLELQQ